MLKQSQQDSEAARYRKILDVTRHLAASVELADLLEEVVDVSCDVLHADRASVFLYDEQRQELFSKVARGAREIRFSVDTGIAGHAVRTREIVNVPDAYNDSRFNTEIDRQTHYRTNNLLTIPLIGDDDRVVGVLQVLNKQGGPFVEQDEQLAHLLAAHCAVAIARAILFEDRLQKEKLERDLAVASDIQMRVLPERLPPAPGYDLAGWSQPAEQTGGDIYDVIHLGSNRLALLLGDATGHGIGPALCVTQMRAMLRLALRLDAELDDTVRQVNAQLHHDLPANRFVTAFIGILDAAAHTITYQAAGQAPLLHYVADTGRCDRFNATTVPLGIIDDLEMEAPRTVEMSPGDVMALISDGIFEYQNHTGCEFSAQRVEELIAKRHDATCNELLTAIRDEVARHADGAPQKDDMTILLVKRRAESTA